MQQSEPTNQIHEHERMGLIWRFSCCKNIFYLQLAPSVVFFGVFRIRDDGQSPKLQQSRIRYFCPILVEIRIEVYQQILVKLPNIKSHENPFGGSRVVTYGEMVNLHCEVNGRVSAIFRYERGQLCSSTNSWVAELLVEVQYRQG
jgi:hypothetical protein